jgi:hypothetical protein
MVGQVEVAHHGEDLVLVAVVPVLFGPAAHLMQILHSLLSVCQVLVSV